MEWDWSYQEIYQAISNGNLQIVEKVLDSASSKKSIRDMSGRTPLHSAIVFNQPSIISFLLERGVNIFEVDKMNKNIFHYCGQVPHGSEMISEIIKYCNDVNLNELFLQEELETGMPPLHFAIKNKNGECAKKLVEIGADINAFDAYQRTPLSIILEGRNDSSLAIWFIHKGAELIETHVDLEPLEFSLIDPAPNNKPTYTLEILQVMFDDFRMSDFQLIVKHKPIHVKKDILSAHSVYFRDLFLQDPQIKELAVSYLTYEATHYVLRWIYLGGEIEEKDLNFLVDIWEVANCFKFKELHRIVQKKIISIFQGKQLLLEQSPSFFYDLRNMFERAYFHKARHINRFCSSYLLDHLDKFLKDSHCFPKGNINNLHEKYVEWLFKALQDNYEDSKQFQDLAQPENIVDFVSEGKSDPNSNPSSNENSDYEYWGMGAVKSILNSIYGAYSYFSTKKT